MPRVLGASVGDVVLVLGGVARFAQARRPCRELAVDLLKLLARARARLELELVLARGRASQPRAGARRASYSSARSCWWRGRARSASRAGASSAISACVSLRSRATSRSRSRLHLGLLVEPRRRATSRRSASPMNSSKRALIHRRPGAARPFGDRRPRPCERPARRPSTRARESRRRCRPAASQPRHALETPVRGRPGDVDPPAGAARRAGVGSLIVVIGIVTWVALDARDLTGARRTANRTPAAARRPTAVQATSSSVHANTTKVQHRRRTSVEPPLRAARRNPASDTGYVARECSGFVRRADRNRGMAEQAGDDGCVARSCLGSSPSRFTRARDAGYSRPMWLSRALLASILHRAGHSELVALLGESVGAGVGLIVSRGGCGWLSGGVSAEARAEAVSATVPVGSAAAAGVVVAWCGGAQRAGGGSACKRAKAAARSVAQGQVAWRRSWAWRAWKASRAATWSRR